MPGMMLPRERCSVETGDEFIRDVFRSSSWREVTEGTFDALGVSVLVLDSEFSSVICEGPKIGYCEAVLGERGTSGGIFSCFKPPVGIETTGREVAECRAGLPCSVVALQHQGRTVCHLVVSGLVNSSGDRERLLERAIAAGVDDDRARVLVGKLPAYGQRRSQAIARMVSAQAQAILKAAESQSRARGRAAKIEALVAASQDLSDPAFEADVLPDTILVRAADLVSADGGSIMLLRSGSDIMDVVACIGTACARAEGRSCRVGDGVAGHVAASGQAVLVIGDRVSGAADDTRSSQRGTGLCVPLRTADALVGVLNLERADETEAFSAADLGIAERYASFAAAALRVAMFHGETQQEILELTQLNEVATALHAGVGLDDLAAHVASVLEKSFSFVIGGVILSGFGHDAGAVVICSDVTAPDVSHVVGEAVGVEDGEEFDISSFVISTHLAELVEGSPRDRADWCVMSVELMVRDVAVGCLFVASPEQGTFRHTDARALRRVAAHVALAFDRAALLERTRRDFAKTIAALSAALDIGERMTRGHTDRVVEYATAIGQEMGLGFEDIEILRFAGVLHDVGKVGLSEEILLKPAELTEDEWARVRRHSEIGAGIVSEIRFLNALAPVILHHHERWDGGGYPMGLSGAQTPLLARILGVADAYDAMRSDTPYRKALSAARARVELEEGAGSQFDPQVVSALLDVLDRQTAAGATGLLGQVHEDGDQLPA